MPDQLDNRKRRDYDTYEQDFCNYYDMDPIVIADIGTGVG